MKRFLIIFITIVVILTISSCSKNKFIRSYNYQDFYFNVDNNFLAGISRIETGVNINSYKFQIVPGLADPSAVSIESAEYKNYYLRHQGGQVKLHEREDSDLYKKDATFRMIPGLADPTWISFQSINYPQNYIRHSGYKLFISPGQDDLLKRDATFKPIKSLQEK